MAEHRAEQLVQPAERLLHLGLDSGAVQHAHVPVSGVLRRAVQQHALSDSGLAAHQERPAAAGARLAEYARQGVPFRRAPDHHVLNPRTNPLRRQHECGRFDSSAGPGGGRRLETTEDGPL